MLEGRRVGLRVASLRSFDVCAGQQGRGGGGGGEEDIDGGVGEGGVAADAAGG